MANRQSAQRSRIRKLDYITDLEAGITALQNDLNEIHPQIASWQERRFGECPGHNIWLRMHGCLMCGVSWSISGVSIRVQF